VVNAIGEEDVDPFAFTDDTTILNPVFAGSGGLNVAGDVVEVVVIGGPPFAGYAVIVYVDAPEEDDQVTVEPDAVILLGGANPVVTGIGIEEVDPLEFTDDTTTLKAEFAGNGGLNVAGDVLEVNVIGVPPPTGYAVIVYVDAPEEDDQLTVEPDILIFAGGVNPVVAKILGAEVEPYAFVAATVTLYAVFVDKPVNVTGIVKELIITGEPPATGVAVTV